MRRQAGVNRTVEDWHLARLRRDEKTMALRALVQRRASPSRPADAGRAAPAGAATRAPSEPMATNNVYGPRSQSLARAFRGVA
jgi:hypothetical protein